MVPEKHNPKSLAIQLFCKIKLIKDDNLMYSLNPETSKKLSIQITKLFKDNYHGNDKSKYYTELIECLNEL